MQSLKAGYEKKNSKVCKKTKQPKPIKSLALTKSSEVILSRDEVKSYPVF